MVKKLSANWIWLKQKDYKPYNQTILARKEFKIDSVQKATVRITADSYYRLYINSQWINDGPARGWPDHFQFDSIDVTAYLNKGLNIIEVVCRFDGIGGFKKVPVRAGLLAQLDVKTQKGKKVRIITDESWDVALSKAWLQNTPKININKSPYEIYDARKADTIRYKKAVVLCKAGEGPNRGLKTRETALLSKKPFSFKSFRSANLVERSEDINFTVIPSKVVMPGLIETNMYTHFPLGLATYVNVKSGCKLKVISESWREDHFDITIDGKYKKNGVFELQPGRHLLIAFTRCKFRHDKEISLRFIDPPRMKLQNPLSTKYHNPWCYISFEDYAFTGNDIVWTDWFDKHPEEKAKFEEYSKMTKKLLRQIKDKKSFNAHLGSRTALKSAKEMFVNADEWRFKHRKAIGDGSVNVISPNALITDNAEITTVMPDKRGDVELVYDLGEQNCGYWRFELIAEAGTVIDMNAVEYIKKDGTIQHTSENRNGLRYITKEGVNRFTSVHRRSGRYVFITVREQKKPVHIRKVDLVESTYPVNYAGSFLCSDETLNRIWDISARALKLSMEDVFVDCPAYEQTLWIGDARNEALFAYYTFGSVDIAQNSIRLGAESLRYLPLVGCQVPSCWQCIIPVWSFLWGISVWENYWYSGDLKFLKRMWKAVIKNIKRAEKYLDENGLFSADMWNLFDWADIDQGRDTVIHNSMFMIAAIDAALKCADALKERSHSKWLNNLKKTLTKAVNERWDIQRRSYPDSILPDGTQSGSICRHTSFLSILYDIVPAKHYSRALNNMLKPRKGMVKVGSPFAVLYLYEAMEKAGFEQDIIDAIYENYIPMLEEDATTTWEVFPGSPTSPMGGKFPTRSHCHGWSAAPVYFLNRIILGIKQTATACREFEVSPVLCGLEYAEGKVETIHGPVCVRWLLQDGKLEVNYSAPKEVRVKFKRNDSHKGLKLQIKKIHV